MSDQSITIFHNPGCGTSRNVLKAIKDAGHAPMIVPYLERGWTLAVLKTLLKDMNARPRDLLRARGTSAEELGLTQPTATDDEILAAMIAHPVLVNRPIVVTAKGTRLCRPAEVLAEIL